MRALTLSLLFSLALPLLACAQATGRAEHPALIPAGGPLILTPFTPPDDYARWYANMEKCADVEGDYSQIKWYVVPAPWVGTDSAHATTRAFWIKRDDTRRIIVNAQEWRDSVLVEHEMLHDVLSYRENKPTVEHPAPWFDGKCSEEVPPVAQ
jgi:hypothetical protein